MVKIITLLFVILISSIIFISPISADVVVDSNLPTDNFLTEDTTPDFNFTYTGNESIAFCAVYLNGFVYGNLYEWCYQESANVSTVCGGLNTGGYSCEGVWAPKGCEFAYDENWGECGSANKSSIATLYINYTIPNNSLNTSLWKLKYDSNQSNHSIENGCFNGDVLQFRVYSAVNENFTDSRSTWYCWDYNTSIWWAIIGWTPWENGNGMICEEAMWWKMVTTNATNNTSTIITADPPLMTGVYSWYVNCTAGGIMNQSEVRTLVIYECPECNESCLSEGQNDTIYAISNQTNLIYNLNKNNYMNPAFLLWIILFLGSSCLLIYGSYIKKIVPLFCSTILFSVVALYSFGFVEIIGVTGTWIMIGVSMIGFFASLIYLLNGLVQVMKMADEPKEDLKL